MVKPLAKALFKPLRPFKFRRKDANPGGDHKQSRPGSEHHDDPQDHNDSTGKPDEHFFSRAFQNLAVRGNLHATAMAANHVGVLIARTGNR